METTKKTRAIRACAVLLGSAGALALLVFVLRPPCLVLRFTGLYCPGCGAQRMALALLRGDLSAALRCNPLLFISAPFLLAWAVAELIRYIGGKRPLFRSRGAHVVLAAYAAAALVFTVLRNLPGLEWLRP